MNKTANKVLLKFRNFFIGRILNEKVSPFIVLFLVNFKPAWVNKYYRIFYGKYGFISEKQRIDKTDSPLDDFVIDVNGLKNVDEINIVMRGNSFQKYEGVIDYRYPTFYVNYYNDTGNKNAVYITADQRIYGIKNSLGLNPLICVNSDGKELNFKLDNQEHPMFIKGVQPHLSLRHKSEAYNLMLGSGLVVIISLSAVAERINIYGWDHYLDKSLEGESYFRCLFKLLVKPKEYRSLSLIASTILNWNYANRLASCSRFRVKSFLTGVSSQQKIIEKIEMMVYR